jgi:hypothetical protein
MSSVTEIMKRTLEEDISGNYNDRGKQTEQCRTSRTTSKCGAKARVCVCVCARAYVCVFASERARKKDAVTFKIGEQIG